MKFHRKMKEFVGQRAGAQRGIAEFEPRVDLSMGKKIIEIPNRGSGGPVHSASAQNLSLG